MDEHVRSLLTRGRDHYRAGEYDPAERLLNELAKTRQPFPDVYEMLGVIHHQRGEMEEAELMFEEALRLNPTYTEAALHLAVTYNDQGKYDEAREVYERVLSGKGASPRHVDKLVKGKIANMHADVGQAYQEVGDFEEAAAEYRKALRLAPGFLDIRAKLAMALRSCGHNTEAIVELESIKKENPRFLAVRLNLGLAYFADKRLADAEREWREVMAIEPGNRMAKMYLGLIPPKR